MEPSHLELIKEAARKHGITDFTVFYDSSSEKGEHFLGDVTAISVREKHTNKVLNLILKSTHAVNKELGKKRPLLEAFQREYEIYNNILPEFSKFQVAHFLSDPFTGTPKFYGGSLQHGKEAILMENLISSGYKLWKPMEPMNFEHVALVLKEYAKFHAISLSFRHKFRERFEDLTKNIKLTFLEERARKNPEHHKHLKQVILGSGKKAVHGNQKAEEAYRKFEELVPDFWNNNKHPEQDVLVVSHGDCHQYNVMFNYDDKEDSSKPKKVRLIDWQLSSTQSPIHDVGFFLFACGSTEVLRRSEELFLIYHGVIAQNLKEFGCDPVEVFSYETFLEHWKKHFLYGLYRAQTVLKLTLAAPEEVTELGQSTSILDILKKEFSESSRFPQRIRDLFEVVGEKWL